MHCHTIEIYLLSAYFSWWSRAILVEFWEESEEVDISSTERSILFLITQLQGTFHIFLLLKRIKTNQNRKKKKEVEDYQLMRAIDIVRTMAITQKYDKQHTVSVEAPKTPEEPKKEEPKAK